MFDKNERIRYLNQYLQDKEDFSYNGPKLLYKYRSFDKYTYEMLENNYLFLCPSTELDDESECIASIDPDSFMDLTTNNLKVSGLETIIRMIKPYCKNDTFDMVRNKIYEVCLRNGKVRNHFLIDIVPELQDYVDGVDIVPFVNTLVNFSDKLDDPEIKKQFIPAMLFAMQREKIGICALGESSDNEDLWNRYGNKHAGYCIEYETGDLFKRQVLLPVVYEDERQTNICLAIVSIYIGQLVTLFSEGKIPVDLSQYLRLFVTKYRKWEEQSEWRIVGTAFEKPAAPKIARVIIGSLASQEDKTKMIRFCEEHTIPYTIENPK